MYTHISRGSHQLRLNRAPRPALITTCCAGREPALADPAAASIVLESLLWLDAQQRLILYAAVIMSDHVHFVADPLASDWRKLLRSMKSFTAHEINKQLQRTGSTWQVQYHDHAISSDAQLLAAVNYCLENPVRAGLVMCASEWRHAWSRFPLE